MAEAHNSKDKIYLLREQPEEGSIFCYKINSKEGFISLLRAPLEELVFTELGRVDSNGDISIKEIL